MAETVAPQFPATTRDTRGSLGAPRHANDPLPSDSPSSGVDSTASSRSATSPLTSSAPPATAIQPNYKSEPIAMVSIAAPSRGIQKQYTHIPSCAALDFARTATPESNSINPRNRPRHACTSRQKQLTMRDREARIAAEAILFGTGYPQHEQVRRTNSIPIKPVLKLVPPQRTMRDCNPFELTVGDSLAEGNKSERPSLSSIRCSGQRPDWTEQDECGPSDTPGFLTGTLWPFLKKAASTHQMKRGCEQGGVLSEKDKRGTSAGDREGATLVAGVRRIVMDDTVSVLSDEGRLGLWNCARFMHR